ncbi:MAG: hypothetical protein WC374_12660, partial [Phycisphaerae bacterium]
LLAEPELKAQALEDLKAIRDLDDSKALRVVSMNEKTGEAKTEEIDNPMPLWKVKGFARREDVAELIVAQEAGNE